MRERMGMIMPSLKGLEWTFDTVAEKYERMRPGDVDELYQEIFDYIPIDENSNVILNTECYDRNPFISNVTERLTPISFYELFTRIGKMFGNGWQPFIN